MTKEIDFYFDFISPYAYLAYKKIQSLEDSYWSAIKQKQISQIIEACAGLYLEASAESSSGVPNANIELAIEVLNRNSEVPVFLESMSFKTAKIETVAHDVLLENNVKQQFKQTINLENLSYTDPYWLQSKGSLGMYQVDHRQPVSYTHLRAHET